MITTIFQKQDPGTKSKTNRNVDKGTSELKSTIFIDTRKWKPTDS